MNERTKATTMDESGEVEREGEERNANTTREKEEKVPGRYVTFCTALSKELRVTWFAVRLSLDEVEARRGYETCLWNWSREKR